MAGGRRNFLGRLATGAAAAAAGLGVVTRPLDAEPLPRPVSDKWDMSWVDRITGKFRGVFDSPKIEDGGEIWRAATWRNQIIEVYGVKDADVNAVLVIRHAGIPLVMNDAFWARHHIGKKRKVKDPLTGKTAETNPIGNFEGRKVPDWLVDASIARFIQRGGIVLACNFAFAMMVHLEAEADKEHAKEARERAVNYLMPGVILQPSGFFGLLEAQRAGCQLFTAGE
ncbi:MAG TPA: twin-arginine translocation signal domain-containing protein [Gemmatimonadales bacterium]|nr:twin-arginine translocation signal domain-containing protein [Gemmatimonadales bacterium]